MFTEFDVAVSVILLVTTITGVIKGAIKEVLSIISWGGAAVLTLYFYPYAPLYTEGYFSSSYSAGLAAVIGLFLLSLVICTGIATIINASLYSIREGIVDRLMGIMIGFLKGYVIVSAIHYIVFLSSENEEDPEWLSIGETYSFTKQGADFFDTQFRDFIIETKEGIDKYNRLSDEEIEEAIEDFKENDEEIIEEVIE